MNYSTVIGNIITFKWRRSGWPEGQHIFCVLPDIGKAIQSFAECIFLAEPGQPPVQWAPSAEDEAGVDWVQFTAPAPAEEEVLAPEDA